MRSVGRFSMAVLLAVTGGPALAAETAPTAANGSAQANALGQCFVDKSTGEDRIAVARWMLAAMASAPKMADITRVAPDRKVALDKGMAAIFTRLITVDCAREARPLFLAKSKAGFEVAGGALGEIAMKELLSDPKAMAGLSEYVQYLDRDAFAGVVK